MFHYKTMWCPFNLTNHDKALCVYAHNWQDFRRRPDCHEYENEACPNWKSEEFIGDYSYGCKNRFDCNKCHGWKEFEFHPLQYKTRPCKNLDRCTKEGDCPMYHCDTDKRVVDPRVEFHLSQGHTEAHEVLPQESEHQKYFQVQQRLGI